MKPPLKLSKSEESFMIRDAEGVLIAVVYFEDEAGRRRATNRLTSQEAATLAKSVAKHLSVPGKPHLDDS